MGETTITPQDILSAADAGRAYVKHTPITPSAALSELCGGTVVLKAENLQRTGSFKIRGALNKLSTLGASAQHGVVAGSAGNHAGALAFAAKAHGVKCEIFVPSGASLSKIAACRAYGATASEGGESLDNAVAQAMERAHETGMAFCHPYDDLAVIGGGGLAGGTAIALKQFDPSIKVIGVQVSACAPYAHSPAPDGPVVTLADGIAVKRPGAITRPIIEKWLDDVVVVDEEDVADAMILLMERGKLLVEGGGAVGVSALMRGLVSPSAQGTTCVVLSGGNVDMGLIPGLIRRHETQAGRRLIVFVRISDRPGGLAQLLSLFAENGANLVEVEHVREGVDLHVRETGVQIVLETRGPEHAATVLAAARSGGYEITELTR
jgi:threonine dehydratase